MGTMAATVELEIGGMTCTSCVNIIETVLGSEGGIASVSVNLATDKGQVTYSPSTITPEQIVSLIESVCVMRLATVCACDADTLRADWLHGLDTIVDLCCCCCCLCLVKQQQQQQRCRLE